MTSSDVIHPKIGYIYAEVITKIYLRDGNGETLKKYITSCYKNLNGDCEWRLLGDDSKYTSFIKTMKKKCYNGEGFRYDETFIPFVPYTPSPTIHLDDFIKAFLEVHKTETPTK